MFIDHIKRYLESGEARPPKAGVIRASSLGYCGRKLAYQFHGVEGDPLTWRSKAIFNDGDLAHDQIRGWLKKALADQCHELVWEEKEVEIRTPDDHLIPGHVDGVLLHKPECGLEGPLHRHLLLEVKSMNKFSFQRFEKGEYDEAYRVQLQAYMKGMSLDGAIVIAKCKDTAALGEMLIEYDEKGLHKRLLVADQIYASRGPKDLPRDYEPSAKGKLPWNCAYCAYVLECWSHRNVRKVGERKYEVD